MQYEIWKGRKKSLAKGGIEPGSIVSKDILVRGLPSEPLQLMCYIDSAVLFLVGSSYDLIQSAVSNLFP